MLPDVGELRQQGRDAAHQAAHQETSTKYPKEVQDCLDDKMRELNGIHIFSGLYSP